MITETHPDGGCFKLCVVYTNYISITITYIAYGDDLKECLDHGLECNERMEKKNLYPIDFRVVDGSK